MTIQDGVGAALRGMQSQLEDFERTARRIAFDEGLDELPRSLVELRTQKHGVAANAAVLRTADELIGELLDIIG